MAAAPVSPDSYLSRLASVACTLDAPLLASAPVAVAVKGYIHNVNLAEASVYLPEKNADKTLEATIGYAVQEAGHIAKMNLLLEEGEKLLASLYSYRSCSRAIPQVQSNEQANRLEMYNQTFDVLQPEVNKMRKFMAFRDAATAGVTDVFANMVPEIRDKEFFPSGPFLSTCARMLDMFVSMDAMKNIKGSMNNDFSMYRRAVQSSQRELSEDETIMQHKLYSFLANQDQYSSELKASLAKLPPQAEEVIVDMIDLCADSIEMDIYLAPKTRHTYYRAMAFGLFLLDRDSPEHDITRRKKFKLERFGKLFKACPVVPLFADQYVFLSTIYGKAPHLANTKWEETEEPAKTNLARGYSLLTYPEMRQEYTEYTALLKRTLNLIRPTANAQLSAQQNATIYAVVLQGVRHLVTLTTRVIEQSAWKYANPVNPQVVPNIPADSLSYELAVRFNYSAEEKRVLIEYTAMIKNLTSMMLSLDRAALVAINQHIFHETQTFIKEKVSEFALHGTKKKRVAGLIMKHLHDVLFDGPPLDDEILGGKKKDLKAAMADTTEAARLNPMTPCQMNFLRAVLNLTLNDRAKGMKGGLMREKDFKDSQVNDARIFVDGMSMYLPMMDIEGTVRELSNLSDLWLKEFYLELSKKVQFPISMSLPWILTEHILESNDPEMTQYMFYPFEMYNDSASRALYQLRSKFLYDELAAEVSLCFDQLIFKISQKIFHHYKKAAACMVLAPDLKSEGSIAQMDLALNAYDAILKQRNYQLLGRSLNIPELIAQMMNTYLRKSIDIAISRYEASDLTYIMDLDTLLRTVQTTHQLLSERMTLDPFENMLAEVDESISLSATNGRIISHTIAELLIDIAPNFCYNNVTARFLRGPVAFTPEVSRHSFPKAPFMYLYGSKPLSLAFTAQNGLYKNFLGAQHFQAVKRWVGRNGIPAIIAELAKHVDSKIKDTIAAYIGVIAKGTPQTMKLPLFEYGTAGTFEYFSAHLRPLILYQALKSEVLQAFREVGNAVLVVKMLEDALAMDDTFLEVQTSGFVPRPVDAKATNYHKLKDFDHIFDSGGYATPFSTWVEQNERSYAPAPPIPLLGGFLTHLRGTLDSVADEWRAEGHLENPRAFFRVWSALQFTFCVPSVGEGRLVRELFGEGISWAGCTFIYLLNQHDVYTAFDFNNHVLSVQRADRKAAHLSFGFGQYGGSSLGHGDKNALAAATAAATAAAAAAAAASAGTSPTDGSSPVTLSPLSATIAITAAGLRPDIAQFLESAAFYQNVNEEVFAMLQGMEAVA
ncbi:Cytoplasmic FMR1-interacting protein 2 [Geranomyces variabilis]|nr:Cytoplasmic FMR1-interacting protein 2 [Geranomyces variabilis]